MKFFVTGGAGFIGSHLVDMLAEKGDVTVYDNLSLGKKEFIESHLSKKGFKFIKEDLLNLGKLKVSMKDHDAVFHMAANSDIALGTMNTDVDLKQGIIATYNVLESMRLNNIKKIVFASTSAVYGEAEIMPTPENYGAKLPISLYGASKLAGEGLISAFCHLYGMQSWIFRFANVIGERSTHGAMYDFVKKLRKNPKELQILGDGHQRKPYLYVKDCADGMIFGFEHSDKEVNIFNLGCDGNTDVNTIAKIIIEEIKLNNVRLCYTGGKRGWPGDVALVAYDTSKMKKMGWKPRFTSDGAVRKAVTEYLKHG
ncbi:NAD-dependent epimerase/dehydratase family protein [Candidatus Woesearchaeota archaeon]|nr:NAD-dependent epimerase/dehydratase family protein [Candidatus Woesearchaeota archaeon]